MARINRDQLVMGLGLLARLFGKRKWAKKLDAAADVVDAYDLVRDTLPSRSRLAVQENRAIRLTVEETGQLNDLFQAIDMLRGKL